MRYLLLSLLSGFLLAFAWPTYGFSLLLFVAFIPLLLAEFEIRQSQLKRKILRVFCLAYLSFFLWNLFSTYWLWYADPFGCSFAILVNSLLMALVFLLYHIVAKKQTQRIALVFLIAIWLSFEKLHLGWEFSWPWLNLGNGFSRQITWIQWYEYTGTFGGSLWVWIVNVWFFKAYLAYAERKQRSVLVKAGIKNALVIFLPILFSLYLFYSYEEKGPHMEAVLLQPNIDPYNEKYNTTNASVGKLLLDLANKAITDSTDFVIAPETVFATHLRIKEFDSSSVAKSIKRFTNKHANLNFLSGGSFINWITVESEIKPKSNFYKNNIWYDDYNSAFLINASDSTQIYHKSKLVVGVENFPYQGLLKPLIGDAMIDLGGTVSMKTTQDYRGVFVSSNSKFKLAPIICYESVYGEFVTEYVRNGANVLSIITNDAWWGNTQGHKQHLSYASLRAIETRRAIARSANTGISAFINAKGEIVSSMAYDKQGALLGHLIINEDKTFYVKAGDYIARIALFLALFIFLFSMVKKRASRSATDL